MTNGRVIAVAAFGDALVAALTLLYYGENAMGAQVAARNTARFSGFVFALALASLSGRFGNSKALILGFVAAHYVHFGAVIHRAVVMKYPLFMPPGVFALAAGFTLVTLVGLLASAGSRAARSVHAICFYIVWVAFVVAFGSNAMEYGVPSAVMLAVVLLAMAVRVFVRVRRSGGRGTQKSAEASA